MTVLTMSPARLELRRDDADVLCTIPDDNENEKNSYMGLALELELEMEIECDPNVIYIQRLESSHDDSSSYRSLAYKTVRFSIQPTKVHEHIHRHDMTPDEKASCWISSTDMRRIRSEVIRTRQLLSKGSMILDDDNSEFCQRGLALRKRHLVLTTRAIVLEEQDRQRNAGIENQLLISSKYTLACQEAILASQARGVSDYEELSRMEGCV